MSPAPPPTPEALARQIHGLRGAGLPLRRLPVQRLIEVLDRVGARFRRGGEQRRPALDALALSGFAPVVLEAGLDAMFEDWRWAPLRQWVCMELGSLQVLDGFVEQSDGTARQAVGPELLLQVLPNDVPDAGLLSLARGILCKSPQVLKLGSRSPAFLPLVVKALAEEESLLGEATLCMRWQGGNWEGEEVLAAAADTIVVHGDDATIARWQGLTGPTTRLVGRGHRLGVTCVSNERLTASVAASVVEDVVCYDQAGCLSSQLVLAEGSFEQIAEWADALARAFEDARAARPRRPIAPGDAATIVEARAGWEFGGQARVKAGPGTSWTVVLRPGPAPFQGGPGHRFLEVQAVPSLLEAFSMVLQPLAGRLQGVGLAAPLDCRLQLAQALAPYRPARIHWPGRAQQPPIGWPQDNLLGLASLLRFVSLERAPQEDV